jgi:hypothetical protein
MVTRLVLSRQTTDEAVGILVWRFPTVVSLEVRGVLWHSNYRRRRLHGQYLFRLLRDQQRSCRRARNRTPRRAKYVPRLATACAAG